MSNKQEPINDMIIVSMYDKKAGEFLNLEIEKGEVLAERNFVNAVKTANPNSLIATCTADFALYKLGTIDMVSGFIVDMVPEIIVDGASIVGGK